MEDRTRTNVIINIARTLVLTILSFITFPWVCRYLGSTSVGIYTWCLTFVSYFLVLAKVGIPNLAIRECVKVKDDKEKLSNKVQLFFIIQMVTTVLSFGLMCALVFSIPAFTSNNEVIFLLAINFLSGAFSFEWLFIALEKQFYMSVRTIVVLALTTILIISFVTAPGDIYIYALITSSVTLLTTIANLIYSTKFISLKKTMPYELKQYIKPLAVLCSISLIITLYNQTDTFILGFIDEGKEEVASYSVGIKGIDVIIGVITALSTVFIPRAAICYAQEDKKYFYRINRYSVNICLFIVLPAIATMTTLAKPITALISGNYSFENDLGYINAPLVLIIVSSMMLTYSISDIIYGQILLPTKKEKYYLYAIGGGTILNIVLSIVLGKYAFPASPAIGVAIGTAATDLLILLFLFIVSWKWINKAVLNLNSLKLVIATVLVFIFTFFIRTPFYNFVLYKTSNIPLSMVIELVSLVLIDAIIYISSLLLMKEELVTSFLRKKDAKNA